MSAGDTIFSFPATSFIGDQDAQLVAGDAPAPQALFKGRPAVSMDDTAEEAFVTPEMPMPAHYGGGGLKAIAHFFTASDATNDIRVDVFVEAKTPNADTLDMETATSWDTVNSESKSVGGTTAGDPLTVEVTLTNKGSVAVGDLVRFGMRRDTDHADDDVVGDIYITALEIQET